MNKYNPKERKERNKMVVYLIDKGLSYRDIEKATGIKFSRVYVLNKIYKDNRISDCVVCKSKKNLILGKPRDICRSCANKIKKM